MLNKDIYLSEEEQIQLREIIRKGMHNSHVITRARVLLMLDRTGKSDHVRYKRTNHDIESYLTRKKRETPARTPKLDGEAEAKIIALACSKPPEGCSRWTVRLLRDQAVQLHLVDELSHMTVQRLLKKRNISLT